MQTTLIYNLYMNSFSYLAKMSTELSLLDAHKVALGLKIENMNNYAY